MPKKKVLHYQLKKPANLSAFPHVKGWDVSSDSIDALLSAFATTGLQASELSKGVDILRMMKREEASIFLSFTSNMISSGVREQIKYLVKEKHVSLLATSGGGVEEDVLKARLPFHVGSFAPSGEVLYENGVCRIGNIYATTEHYAYLEQFLQGVFMELYAEQKKTGVASSPSDLIWCIGKRMSTDDQFDYKSSYIYWAYTHGIRVFCPGIVDGAIGDMLYFFKKQKKDFVLDVTLDHQRIIDTVLSCEKVGALLLGGGIAKHYVLNANIFREGVDYAVYVTTASEADGSDSGGNPEEAVTWSKIQLRAPRVKVVCDASIAAPLLIYGAFAKR